VTPYAKLLLEAKLNVYADAAAMEYQTGQITGNGVQLIVQGMTVTHHYVHMLRTCSFPLSFEGLYRQAYSVEYLRALFGGLG
jgi:hypothetical protein